MGRNRMAGRTCVRLAAAVVALSACVVLGGHVRSVEARAGGHPLYDDGNTLRWYDSLAEAQSVARLENKLLLVDVSVRNCPACSMVIRLLGDPAVAGRLSRIAVGYHVDGGQVYARHPSIARAFRGNLRRADYLPWVGFFTPATSWITGLAPSQRTTRPEMLARIQRALRDAEAEQARRSARPAAAAPARRTPRAPTPAVAPSAPTPSATAASRLVWHERIADAQAAARAQGKLIFITSTKPSCSLCKKLKERIVPQVWRELSKGCVFYIYDITRPESGRVDSVVRANLTGAYLMPLAGFVTADLQWRHGFFGSTDAQKLMSDYETARRGR